MLIVTLQNVSTREKFMDGSDCEYNVRVYANKELLWEGKVEHHDRLNGWRNLLSMLAAKVNLNAVYEPTPLKNNPPFGKRGIPK